MTVTIFDIEEKRREAPVGLADINDFGLRQSGQIATETILENPNITLYTLDLDNRQAVFVETPPDVNLSHAPFYYAAQYEHAARVLTIPFETMLRLAQSVPVDDKRLVFIHSVARAGSTLASQIFAQVDGVVNISEPDALTLLVRARYYQPDNEDGLKVLLEAAVRLLCKTPAPTGWVIKGRSFVIQLGDWLHHCFPHTKNLFLYRDAETWLISCIRAFGLSVDQTDEERLAAEKRIREFITPVSPLVAQYNEDRHLPYAGILSLMWLSVMERYLKLHEMGIEMLAIRYAGWRETPRETAAAMLDYCGFHPADMTAIYDTLSRDSQAGTILSQEAVLQHKSRIQASDRQELNRHLQNHPAIQIADFEVPNTL